jgi:hypothetical protein
MNRNQAIEAALQRLVTEYDNCTTSEDFTERWIDAIEEAKAALLTGEVEKVRRAANLASVYLEVAARKLEGSSFYALTPGKLREVKQQVDALLTGRAHKGMAGVGDLCCDPACWCGGMPAAPAASGAPAPLHFSNEQGEFYPCKPDVFAATYEPVAPAQPEKGENAK